MPGSKRTKNIEYRFDHVFSSDSEQADVYDKTAKRAIGAIMNGINASVFAYGATGSGKTFTMVGSEQQPGVMVRAVEDLFGQIRALSEEGDMATFEVSLSYLEVYNETIRDLLRDNSGPLQLNEEKNGMMSVKGLTEKRDLKNTSEVFHLLKQGNSRRSQCATDQNQTSSRSHAVLQIVVKKLGVTGAEQQQVGSVTNDLWTSKLSLIDLAGSERAASSTNSGSIQKEGANINQSLLALGNVINALAMRSKAAAAAAAGRVSGGGSNSASASRKKVATKTGASTSRSTMAPATARPKTAVAASSPTSAAASHIPYRGSKLTRLLKDSLGGRCMTVMIAAVSPSRLSREDTHGTLKYANRAKQIKVEARANVQHVKVHMAAYAEQIKMLQAQVNLLAQDKEDAKARERAMQKKVTDAQTALHQLQQQHHALQSQQLQSQQQSSSHTTAGDSSQPDSTVALAAISTYTQRFTDLFDSKDEIEVELNRLRCSNLSLRVHQTLYARMAGDDPSMASLAQQQLSARAEQLDAQRRSQAVAQKHMQSTQLEPVQREIACLRLEIELDPSLGLERSTALLSAMDLREAMRGLEEKDEAINGYSELVSAVSAHAHAATDAAIRLREFVRLNSASLENPDALFRPQTHAAHARFVEGVTRIVDGGLALPSSTEEDDEDSSAVDLGGTARFVVETIRVEHEPTDEADEEAVPEPPRSYASAATPSRAPRLLSASAAQQAQAQANSHLPPITPRGHHPVAAFTAAPPAQSPPPSSAARGNRSAAPTPTPRRRSGRKHKQHHLLSMTPLVRPATAGGQFSSPSQSSASAAPETPKPSYAAVMLAATLSSPQVTKTPSRGGQQLPRPTTTPLLQRPVSVSRAMFVDHSSPSPPSVSVSSSSASSVHEVPLSPAGRRPKQGGAGGNITDQLSQWHAELSQLTVMQAEQTQAKPKLLTEADADAATVAAVRAHRRQPSRPDGPLLHTSNSLPSLSVSASMANVPILPLTSSASTSSLSLSASASSPAPSAASAAGGIKSLRARLQNMTRPGSVTQLPPMSVLTAPQASSAPRAGGGLLRKPPVPKSATSASSSASSSSSATAATKRPLLPSSVSPPTPHELENEEDATPAPAPVASRPPPLGVRTETYASQHNQRQIGPLSNGGAPKHKLMSLPLNLPAKHQALSPRAVKPALLQRPFSAAASSPRR